MSNLQGLEFQKKAHQEALKLSEALERLQKNKDYKAVFETELFKVFAAECVMAKGNPAMQGESQQKAIDADIQMLGTLNSRLVSIHALGANAPEALKAIDLEIERLVNSDDEDEE